MTKIKICGLSRPCDIMFVNEAVPDFCGFIIDVPKSHRTISAEQLRQLRPLLNPEITPVGVFVNAPAEAVASLLNQQLISAAQLHGQEDDSITKLFSSFKTLLFAFPLFPCYTTYFTPFFLFHP